MDKVPTPQWSFANVTSSQWTTLATWILIGPAGIYYKALAAKYNLPDPDPDSFGNFLMQAVPWAVGMLFAWWRRTEPKVLELAARILAAQQHPAAASVAAAAEVPPKPTGTTLLPLLVFLLAVPLVGGGLVACTTAPDGSKAINASAVGTAANDAALIAAGLKNAVALLPGTGVNISADDLTLIQNSVNGLQGLASSMAGASSSAAAQSLVPQIEGYVNAVVGTLAVALAPCGTQTCNTIKGIAAAAGIVLPVLEMGLNMVIAQAPPPATADAARATLSAPAK